MRGCSSVQTTGLSCCITTPVINEHSFYRRFLSRSNRFANSSSSLPLPVLVPAQASFSGPTGGAGRLGATTSFAGGFGDAWRSFAGASASNAIGASLGPPPPPSSPSSSSLPPLSTSTSLSPSAPDDSENAGSGSQSTPYPLAISPRYASTSSFDGVYRASLDATRAGTVGGAGSLGSRVRANARPYCDPARARGCQPYARRGTRRGEARRRPRRTHLVHQHLAQDLELLELRPRRSVDDRAHRVRDGGLGLGGSALASASIH
jgi:hypothetical protein